MDEQKILIIGTVYVKETKRGGEIVCDVSHNYAELSGTKKLEVIKHLSKMFKNQLKKMEKVIKGDRDHD